MKKILMYLGALVLVLFLSLAFFSPGAGADVGDFNDYDSGSDWGSSSDSDWDSGSSSDWGSSDSDWSSSDSDWDSDSSSSSSSSSGYSRGYGGFSRSTINFFIIAAFLIIFVGMVAPKKQKGNRKPATRPAAAGPMAGPKVNDHTNEIVQAIMKIDPRFTNDRFIAWVKEVFFTLQYAWMERDWGKVRPFEKEELYKQHEMQIQQYINNKRINVLERININQAYLQKYVRDSDYEYLTVFLQVRMTDYIKDEKTGAVIKGSPNVDSHMKYLYTFMRKKGVLTNPASSNMSTTNCPNCGAPTKITSAGKCEYCNSVITTGAFDWVLSNIDGVKPQTVIDDSGVIIR